MEVQIVVPCYNEERRFNRASFERFLASQGEVRFLFVNDGSTDETKNLLDDMYVANVQRVDVMHLPRNMGKAEAVRRGMLQAMMNGQGAAGYWDADLSTPLEAIPLFQEALQADPRLSIVLGTRIPLLGREIQRGLVRQKLGRLFAVCASRVIGLPVFDTQCGAKLLRINDATRQLFQVPFISRWIFDVEMLVRWRLLCRSSAYAHPHAQIYELPLPVWREVAGSKLKSLDFVRAIGEMWHIWRKYSKTSAISFDSPSDAIGDPVQHSSYAA